MAKLHLGYPIKKASGRIAGGLLRSGSTVLLPQKPPHISKKTGKTCECRAWKHADALWAKGWILTDPWRKALKRRCMSAYDLWMHEALYWGTRGHYYPDEPSRSGGYSFGRGKPGTKYQPPNMCIPQFHKLTQWQAITHHCRGLLWQWHVIIADRRPPPIGLIQLAISYYPYGLAGGITDSLTLPPYDIGGTFVRDPDGDPWMHIITYSRDGLVYGDWYHNGQPELTPDQNSYARDRWLHMGWW